MNNISMSILISAIIFCLSFLLLRNLGNVSILYLVVSSFNFGTFVGIVTFETLARNIKRIKADRARINIKEGWYTGISIMIIMAASSFGV